MYIHFFREAACRPASGSLIAEMFESSSRGVANGKDKLNSTHANSTNDVCTYPPTYKLFCLGIFSWGVYIGYGLTFTLGNYLQDIGDFSGWRLAFVIGCVPGFIVAFLLFFVKDPRKDTKPNNNLYGESKKSGTSYGSSGSGNNSKETGKNSKKKRKRSAVIREEKNYFKIVILALIQPAMVLLFVAAAVRHTGIIKEDQFMQ